MSEKELKVRVKFAVDPESAVCLAAGGSEHNFALEEVNDFIALEAEDEVFEIEVILTRGYIVKSTKVL